MLYGTVTEFCTPQEVGVKCLQKSQLVDGFMPNSVRLCLLVHGQFIVSSLYSIHRTNPGHSYEYLWEDGVKFKRPTKLPAPEYVDALMNWAQNLLDDENVFPNKIGPFG